MNGNFGPWPIGAQQCDFAACLGFPLCAQLDGCARPFLQYPRRPQGLKCALSRHPQYHFAHDRGVENAGVNQDLHRRKNSDFRYPLSASWGSIG